MALNKVIASPSFGSWLTGPPLDVASLIRSPEGKTRVSVFYIAHLNQAEREFFVTLLLEQVISWMRQQSGTTSLRCLVYFDEVFGYLPPYPANPPSKQPIMTLMKQARAFGIGMILTTQNPVDLDYKGLTNAGTWFIGKLQTERDKARLLEGLDSVVAEAGTMLDRAYLDRLISSSGPTGLYPAQRQLGSPQALSDALGAKLPAWPAHPPADSHADAAHQSPNARG